MTCGICVVERSKRKKVGEYYVTSKLLYFGRESMYASVVKGTKVIARFVYVRVQEMKTVTGQSRVLEKHKSCRLV